MAEIVRDGIDKASKGLYLEEQSKLAQEVSKDILYLDLMPPYLCALMIAASVLKVVLFTRCFFLIMSKCFVCLEL